MATRTLDGNPAASAFTGSEIFALIQSGSDVSGTINGISDFISSSSKLGYDAQSIVSSGSVTLTNPIKNMLVVTLGTAGSVLTLPPMNQSNSFPKGRSLLIVNYGASDLLIAKNGNTGTPDYTIPVNNFLRLECIDNTGANGLFFVENYQISSIYGLQAALDSINSDINVLDYDAQSIVSSGSVTLTNPIKNMLVVTLGTAGSVLTLPPMNQSNSFPKGRPLLIVNYGASDLLVAKNGNTGSPDYTVPVNNFLRLSCFDNTGANGLFFVENMLISSVYGLQEALDAKANTDGSNATGTWPINITGTANTANTALNASSASSASSLTGSITISQVTSLQSSLDAKRDIANYSNEISSRTLTAADSGKILLVTGTGNITFTLPTSPTIFSNVGFMIVGNATVTFASQGSDYIEGVNIFRRNDSGMVILKSTVSFYQYNIFNTKQLINNAVIINASTTLDASHCGKLLIFNSSSALTITLPLSSTFNTSTFSLTGSYTFDAINIGAGRATFTKQSTDVLLGNTDLDTNAGATVNLLAPTYYVTGGTSVLPWYRTYMLSGCFGASGTLIPLEDVVPEIVTVTSIEWYSIGTTGLTGTLAIGAQTLGSLSFTATKQSSAVSITSALNDQLKFTTSSTTAPTFAWINIRGTIRR